jgi:PAS domain S-box-containing protein
VRPDPVIQAYREKTWSVAAGQIPFGLTVFLAMVLGATVLDYVNHSWRLPHLVVFDLASIGIAASVAVAARRGVSTLERRAVVAAVLLGFLLSGYGVAVGGSAEMLVISLSILLAGIALLCPWGARGQAIASVGAAIGYPLAILTGAETALDPLYGLGGLAAMVGLTIRGAAVLERHRLSDFRAVVALQGREARLQGYFDLALVGMAGLSPSRTWLEANDEILRILGRSREELLRLRWDDVVHPTEARAHVAWFERAAQGGGGDLRMATLLVGRRGETVPVMVAMRALRSANGSIDSFVALVEDHTERHRVEEELRAAMEQAETANQSKSDFLATMSHEIRTPMNLIFGMTEMALDSDPTPTQREYLRKTRAAAGTLQVLLNDVLDFSKMEAGKLEVRPRPFDLRLWMEESLGPLSWLAREKGIEVTQRVDDAVPPRLLLDPDRLGQVLVNLVTNAIKFTDRGRVDVSVEVDRTTKAQSGRLHFVVADSGIGIREEEQKRIFEAFSQAGSPAAGKRGGAGLGLAICARLVDLMGGRIWVDSREGEGSRFHFSVRFADAPTPVGEGETSADPSGVSGQR